MTLNKQHLINKTNPHIKPLIVCTISWQKESCFGNVKEVKYVTQAENLFVVQRCGKGKIRFL